MNFFLQGVRNIGTDTFDFIERILNSLNQELLVVLELVLELAFLQKFGICVLDFLADGFNIIFCYILPLQFLVCEFYVDFVG